MAIVFNPLGDPFDFQSKAANEIAVSNTQSASYTNLADMNTIIHSAGWMRGGEVADAGGGTIDVTAGSGLIRTSDTFTSELTSFDWTGISGKTITANSVGYVGIETTGTAYSVVVKPTDTWNRNTEFPLSVVVNEADTLHIARHRHRVGDHINKMLQRVHGVGGLERDNNVGGLILSDSGDNNRNLQITASRLWLKFEDNTITAFDSSGADTWDQYYISGATTTGFAKEAAISQWNNELYDDGSDTLQTMTANFWASNYVYQEFDGGVVMQYPRAQYATMAQAEDDQVPATTPKRLQEEGMLIGRLLYQRDANTATAQSVFTTMFNVAGVNEHSELAEPGMATGDNHTQYLLNDGTRALTGEWDAGKTIAFTAQTAVGSNGSTTIDWGEGNKMLFTFGATNETFTFTAPNQSCNVMLKLTQDSTGSRTVTWPASVKWEVGTIPTLSTGGEAYDLIGFFYDGTNFSGVPIFNFS